MIIQDNVDMVINKCTFKSNMLDFANEHSKIKTLNPELYAYFPESYFKESHSPLINIQIVKNSLEASYHHLDDGYRPKEFKNIVITGSIFKDNINV